MNAFDLNVLLLPSLVIFVAAFFASCRVTGSIPIAASISLIKAGLFLAYFGRFFDGTFTFLDDWSYLEGGVWIQSQGVGITNLADNWDFVLMVGQGEHFVYYLYNAYAITLFGDGYYAPVSLNILLTVLIAWIGARLAGREFQLGKRKEALLFIFLILHPDILAWSNVMNGKDVLVLFLHVLLLQACAAFINGHRRRGIIMGMPVAMVLFFLRFYVPVLFTAALLLSQFVSRKRNWFSLLSGAVLTGLVLLWLGADMLGAALASASSNFVNPVFGFVRFILTPIPFNTEEAYGFLDIPAMIHWALFPVALVGIRTVYRYNTPFSRFFLCYVLCFVALYSFYGELQGPRHRVQVDYAWAIFQFLGLAVVLRKVFGDEKTVPGSMISAVRSGK